MDLIVFCNDQQARGVLVQSMNNSRPNHAAYSGKIPAVIEKAMHKGSRAVSRSRMNDNPGRFIYDDKGTVLKYDMKCYCFGP